jgi:F-type H+-transporting ATPase subunit delta
MVNVSVARRYARALIDVAGESGSLDRVADQLEAFCMALQQSPELSGALLDPGFSRDQKIGVLQAVLQAAGGADPLFENLLKLLVERNRLSYLPDIARLYRDMADVRAGRVRGKVTSAAPLARESLERLVHSLERITQRSIVVETQVDPSLLGGVAAQVGSVIYDGTLKTQLEELKQTLSQS